MSLSRRKLLIESAATAAGIGLAVASRSACGEALPNGMPVAGDSSAHARTVLSFNQGWRFFRPDVGTDAGAKEAVGVDDTGWDLVHLPHTVRLEPINASGGRNYQGICWYRRHFQSEGGWKGKKLLLHFGGAMQVADIYLNGKFLTKHYGGYLPFTIDLLDFVENGKENVLAVRLDNSDNPEVPPGKPQNRLDFVYFGGLYRDVDLEVADLLHISDTYLANKTAGGGLFVTIPSVTAASALIHSVVDVINERGEAAIFSVRQELGDPAGEIVTSGQSAEIHLDSGSSVAATVEMTVNNPQLWHPDTPNLYTLRTTVVNAGQVVDSLTTKIGIRTFHFDKDNGLTINGQKYVSLGCNRHQDHPYIGYALSANAQWRDGVRIREAGFTSIRSHYPQHPAFVDACDALGILLIVSNPGWQFIGDEKFIERTCQNAREMVRRDRNHPCVVLWEAQLNETYNKKIFPMLQKIIHEEFPYDPCYTAGDSISKDGDNWDVVYNGNEGQRPYWQREHGDQVDNWGDQQSSVRIMRGWGETPMLVQAWSHTKSFSDLYEKYNNPAAKTPRSNSLCAVNLWAGVDAYRGYHHQPFLGGPIDLFRLPKFDFYLFRSQRPPSDMMNGSSAGGPMVFIANFATFQSPTAVTVFSNCEEVRLTQNGTVVATQKPLTGIALPHPPFRFDVGKFSGEDTTMFMTGVAKPGTAIGELKAEGLIGGQVVATHVIRAPGVPRKLTLEADLCGHDLVADGSDWIRLYARVCDGRGTTHPFANDEVTFNVTGPAVIIDDARIRANPVRAEAGIATALLRSTLRAGPIAVVATAFGLTSAEITFEARPTEQTRVSGRDA